MVVHAAVLSVCSDVPWLIGSQHNISTNDLNSASMHTSGSVTGVMQHTLARGFVWDAGLTGASASMTLTS